MVTADRLLLVNGMQLTGRINKCGVISPRFDVPITQVEQLVASLNGRSQNQAVLFLGDTNLHASEAADAVLISLLEEEGGLVDSCGLVACDEPDHIDRIFVRDSSSLTLTVERWQVEDAFFDSDGIPLSDHPAISARIRWDSGSAGSE